MKTLPEPRNHTIISRPPATGNTGPESEPLDLLPPGYGPQLYQAEADLCGLSLYGTPESFDIAAEYLPGPEQFVSPTPKAAGAAIFRHGANYFDLVTVTIDLLDRGELDAAGGPGALADLLSGSRRNRLGIPMMEWARRCRGIIDDAHHTRRIGNALRISNL